MYYSTTPHSPTSVGSRISDQEPDEEFLGDIVPLAVPFIRPCQGRPNMSAYDIKEDTARDEAEEISRCMRRQDCYSPPSPTSVGSSDNECELDLGKLVYNVLPVSPFIRPYQERPNIAGDVTEVTLRDEEQKIAPRVNSQVFIEEVHVGEDVLQDGPIFSPFLERPNIPGSNLNEVAGRDELQLIAYLMEKQAKIPERTEGICGDILPCWMRFAPQSFNNNGIQYICFVCQCGVNIHPSKVSSHENGKRHRTNMVFYDAPWIKETMDIVPQVYNSFEVDLLIISHKNQDTLGRAISLLQPSDAVSNVYYISVGFYIHYGKLLGLSLASERVCINIDTVLHNRSLIKGCLELRSLFEGSCNMLGADSNAHFV